MAKSATVSRSLKIYLDGKEVTSSVKDIQSEMRKVRRELNNAQVGSDDYRKALTAYFLKEFKPVSSFCCSSFIYYRSIKY
jgi:hypothetical protein